jgi:pimeloyl-ACP methyl ester carboxylesterase
MAIPVRSSFLGGIATLLAMSDVPVVMVHGWGGNFRETWQEPGWEALLNDLLGHGTAPKPHDPAEYANLSSRVTEAVPHGAFDAIGFSLGAITLLRMACTEPTRFRRLVLMGIGESVFRSDPDATNRIIAAVEGTGPADDIASQVFANYAHRQGNDPVALAAVFKRTRGLQLAPVDLAAITCPVLVILGDRDFSGPGEPLVAALPNAKLITLRNTDHFATTENFKAIDAVLDFLADEP